MWLLFVAAMTSRRGNYKNLATSWGKLRGTSGNFGETSGKLRGTSGNFGELRGDRAVPVLIQFGSVLFRFAPFHPVLLHVILFCYILACFAPCRSVSLHFGMFRSISPCFGLFRSILTCLVLFVSASLPLDLLSSISLHFALLRLVWPHLDSALPGLILRCSVSNCLALLFSLAWLCILACFSLTLSSVR